MPRAVPFRVLLTHRGESRKFFTLFQGRDGSLYIHPYRATDQPWRIPGGDDILQKGSVRDFAKFKEPGFELHKISFHPSGYIHLTNRQRERYRDGTRGPAFSDMRLPYEFCILAPPEPEQLPLAGNDRGMSVDIVLPDDVAPFYAALSIPKAGSAKPRCALTLALPLSDSLALLTGVRAVRAADGAAAVWPPFPFFLLRTAA